MSNIFETLLELEKAKAVQLKRIENALKRIHIASGTASVEDYESNKFYKRNTLVVDKLTETLYRAKVDEGFVSTTLDQDLAAGRLKLVGYESQFVAFNHPPKQSEIDALPEDVLVAVYSPQDDPYTPVLSNDNIEE